MRNSPCNRLEFQLITGFDSKNPSCLAVSRNTNKTLEFNRNFLSLSRLYALIFAPLTLSLSNFRLCDDARWVRLVVWISYWTHATACVILFSRSQVSRTLRSRQVVGKNDDVIVQFQEFDNFAASRGRARDRFLRCVFCSIVICSLSRRTHEREGWKTQYERVWAAEKIYFILKLRPL